MDVKGLIKAEVEPEASGSSGAPLDADLGDDTFAGDDGDGEFVDGDDFEGFAQYGDFDDSSLGNVSGSGAMTGDSKGRILNLR